VVRVRIQRIESMRDPDGNLGKRIEFIEDRVLPRTIIQPQTEEARMTQELIQALQQQIPIISPQSQFTMPKLILFLTEPEYERLGIEFNVNQVYELELSDQNIRFRKTP